MQHTNKYLAYYLRLSLDDGNIGDSNSIASQRQLIKEYIYSSDEFVEMQTLEYVDDGYSGTNFNRPGIKRLLEAIKKGEIGCIIVKDFSRFGRNYLEVSKYIEQLFPYIGVRFISINDYYDSNTHKGTTAEIDVPVRNLINELYSIDISKKVKSAKRTKIKQGLCANAYVIYGYRKDRVDKGQLLIDEPAAIIVRQIFQLALDGKTAFQIAERLNNERIPTPSVYKNQTGEKREWNTVDSDKIIWTKASILRILHDERYTGTFIGGMWESGKLGCNEYIRIPKEEWVRISNSHPAIITQDQFDTINEMICRQPSKKTKKSSHSPLSKKVWCGKCGHMLRYRGDTSYPFYTCDTARYSDEHGCIRSKIREKELNETVTVTLLSQINIFIDNVKLLHMIENNINRTNGSADNSILQLDNEIKNLQSNKRKIYERYKNGEINKTLYLQERETLEKELENKILSHESLESQTQSYENMLASAQQLSQTFLKYQSKTELTKEMADEFIEGIYIYDSDKITVKFKFQDEFDRIISSIRHNS